MTKTSTPKRDHDATDDRTTDLSQRNTSAPPAKSKPARSAPGLTSERADLLMSRIAPDTPARWSEGFDFVAAICAEAKTDAKSLLKEIGPFTGFPDKDAARLADVLVALKVIQHVADALDMGEDFKALLALLDLKTGVGREAAVLLHQAHAHLAETAPGLMLVRALSSLLASGGAHVAGLPDPDVPPIPGTDDEAARANLGLGWTAATVPGTASRPNGPCIGTVLKKNGTWIIVFEVKDAMDAARDAYPQLVGERAGRATGWASIWDEELNAAGVARQKSGAGTPISTVRLTMGSGTTRLRPTGVPISVETILSPGVQRDKP